MMKIGRLFLAFLAVGLVGLAAAGCSSPVTVIRTSVSILEGYATHYLPADTYDKTLGASSQWPIGCVYSAPNYRNHIWLLSFDLTGLSGVEVQSARLEVYLEGTSGTPFTTLGDVLTDPIQYNSGTAASSLFGLGAIDLTVWAITDRITSTEASSAGLKTVDVTETVQDMVGDGRTYAQFRLEHQGELGSGATSHSSYWTGSLGASNHPQLVITYKR